jgi:hypothetical protein
VLDAVVCCVLVGQDVNSSASLGPSTNCDMPCPGNTNQTCGGALALNIYEIVNTYWKVAGVWQGCTCSLAS